MWFIGGPETVPVYRPRGLARGADGDGPALIEEAASVTVLEAGHRLRAHPHGHC